MYPSNYFASNYFPSRYFTAPAGAVVPPTIVLPTAMVEIAFSTNPTISPTWIDVTQWTQSFSIMRGRQRELNAIQTGTATVLLDNRDRRFDPSNVAGPYYPNVLPMRRVRISGVWNGVTYPQFSGFIEAWPQTWQGPVDANVQITAADGFKVLNLAQLNATFSQERSDVRIGDVLTAIGWTVGGTQWNLGTAGLGELGTNTILGPTGDRNLGVGHSQIQASTLSKTSALAHMQDVTTTEDGLLFMGKDGRVTFLGHPSGPAGSVATFGELELPYTSLVFQFDDNTIFNDVRMTRVGGTEQVKTDSASQASYFLRTISYSNTLHIDDTRAAGMAAYLLSRYKQPVLEVIGMGLDGLADPTNLWPHILGREIGDVVTVRRRPPGGGAMIEQLSMIQGLETMYSANGGDWLANWRLLVSDRGQYWSLEDPVVGLLGSTTKLFF